METICGRRVLGSTRLIRALLSSLQLNRPTKLCYLLMAGYARDSGQCYASERTLAQDLHSSPKQVRRYLQQLSQAGFIHPKTTPGKVTRYTFLWHPTFAAAISTPLPAVSPPPLPPVSLSPPTSVPLCIGIKKGRVISQSSSSVERGKLHPNARQTPGEDPTTTNQTFKQVREEIWGYFQGDRPREVPPPDRDIVQRCVKALRGHSINDLRALLRERFRAGYKPGGADGPRSYAWFVRLIDNAFSPS